MPGSVIVLADHPFTPRIGEPIAWQLSWLSANPRSQPLWLHADEGWNAPAGKELQQARPIDVRTSSGRVKLDMLVHHLSQLCYTVGMNPKITPEIRSALFQHPVGPIQLDDESSNEPVFVVRLADIPNLQAAVDDRIRAKLAEADADIVAGDVAAWNADDIKQRGRQRLRNRTGNE